MAPAAANPLWVVSRLGVDLAIVSAPTRDEAVAAVRSAIAGLAAAVHLKTARIGSAKFGATGIVRVLSTRVDAHALEDARYFAILSGAARAVGIDPVVADRTRAPKAQAARWATWLVASEEMPPSSVARASRHHRTGVRWALPRVREALAAGTNPHLAAAVDGARAAASLQHAEMS